MEKNSSIFNFNFLVTRITPAAWLAVGLLIASQIFVNEFSNKIEGGSKQIIRWKREWARVGLMNAEPGRKKVFFMGDSKITSGIIPRVFDEENSFKTQSYNLSLPGLPLAPHYFMLRDYLDIYEPPYAIIIKPKPGGFNGTYFPLHATEGAGFSEVLGYTFRMKKPAVMFNFLFPSRQKWPFIEKFIMGEVVKKLPEDFRRRHLQMFVEENSLREKYPHDWENVYQIWYRRPHQYSEEKRKKITDEKGYFHFVDHTALGGHLPLGFSDPKAKEQVPSSDQLDFYSKKFFCLARKYGIRILLIQDYELEGNERKEVELPELWKSLKDEYPNVILWTGGFEPKRYQASYFADPVHLNPEGAMLYTRHIASEFQRISGRA